MAKKYYILLLAIIFSISASDASSLTFVIDASATMYSDIYDIRSTVGDIIDTAMGTKESQVENYVLVTVNDFRHSEKYPGINVTANTKNREKYISALNSIIALGGAFACAELPLVGVRKGIEESLPKSNIFVFTDDSPKDYDAYEQVKKLAQEKQCQIVFVVSGQCNKASAATAPRNVVYQDSAEATNGDVLHADKSDIFVFVVPGKTSGETVPGNAVYQDLAKATNGDVFHTDKSDVRGVLKYVNMTVKGPRTVLTKKRLPRGLSSMDFAIDWLMEDLLLSLASARDVANNPSVNITAPDGSEVFFEKLVRTRYTKILKVNATIPGTYTANVYSPNASIAATVSAKTKLEFQHGFSTFMPSTIDDTSIMPAPGVKSYVSIKLTTGNIKLNTVQILDMDDHVMQNLSLALLNKEAKFYATGLFEPPTTDFKIVVIGYDPESKSYVTRQAPTPMQVQKILPGEKITDKPPSVVVTQSEVKAIYGETLQLVCKVEGWPKPEIVWKHKETGKIFPLKTSPGKNYIYDYVNVLTIGKAIDNATYICEAKNGLGSDRKEVSIKVAQPEKYLEIPTRQNISVNYVISCAVDAHPPANVTWYINGSKLVTRENIEISNHSVLTIKNATPLDNGIYTCEVKNEVTKKYIDYVIAVGPSKVITEITPVVVIQGKNKVDYGEKIQLLCKVKANSKPKIVWKHKKTRQILLEKESFGGLYEYINELTIEEANNNATFICQARNGLGSDHKEIAVEVTPKKYLEIISKSSEIEVEYNNEANLTCTVDAFPPAKIVWYKNNITLETGEHIVTSKDNSVLTIKNSTPVDNGTYTCEANNGFVSDHKEITVKVARKKYLEIIIKTSKIEVEYNNEAKLTCTVDAFPPAKIVWYKNNIRVKIGKHIATSKDNSVLTIKNATPVDNGTYTCKASNGYVSDHKEITVEVARERYLNFTSGSGRIEIEYEKEAKIVCTVDAFPPAQITWYKNGTKLEAGKKIEISEDNSVLTIKRAMLVDKGIYTCEARNEDSSKYLEYQVTIVGVENVEIEKTTHLISIKNKESTSIECKILRGKPKPTISWTFVTPEKYVFVIDKWEDQEKNMIEDANQYDAGIYRCKAENEISADSHEVKLVVT